MNDGYHPASPAATRPAKTPGPNGRLTLARVLRLALKELRETLRDRRTIITLIVMPLLVYPVLSVALKQFLITSSAQSQKIKLQIATDTQEESLMIGILLQQGDRWVQGRESVVGQAAVTGAPKLGADLASDDPPLSDIRLGERDGSISLEDMIRNGMIDLGVRLMPEAPDVKDEKAAERRFQLIYRPSLPISRQAASYVERRLRAANDHDLQERLAAAGQNAAMRASWRMMPIADEQGQSFWLGTLLPLILILMTITGAVYPAIDLTAGERERGTLESLMAAPVPRLGVLIAKYIAVVTVATMTAVVNLTAMTVTLAASGKDLWQFFFGTQGSPAEAIVAVLLLLVLFSMFFSAVLLLVTSFARSFKEAQAYVVPLMVVALAPGFISVMPGLELGPLFSVIPLANIVLLARDVLEGHAPLLWGAVAVLSTILYGAGALALAARVFGSDAILYGSEGSWGDLFRRPREPRPAATISGALAALAIVTPLFVVVSGLLAGLQMVAMQAQLFASCGAILLIFIVVPLQLARMQGVRPADGFQLHRASTVAFVAAVVLGCSLWPLAYNSIIACQHLEIATISTEKLAEHRPALLTLIERLRAVSPGLVLLALALTPAVAEEFFFRGYLLGALRGKLPAAAAIGITALVFGVFHASVGGLIAIERVLSSTLLGVVLGFICWKSGSIFPGMLLHALHNGLLLSLVYVGPRLQAWGFDSEGKRYLPLALVGITTLLAAGALGVLTMIGREPRSRVAANATENATLDVPADEPVEAAPR